MLSLTGQPCCSSCIHSQGLPAARGAGFQRFCLTPGCREAQSSEPTALPADCQLAQATARQNHRVRGSAAWCNRTHEQAVQLLAGLGGSNTKLHSQVLLHSRECGILARRLRCYIPKAGWQAIVLMRIAIGCCHTIQRQRALLKACPCERLTGIQSRLAQPPQDWKHLWCVACTAEGCAWWGTCCGTVLQGPTLHGTGLCSAHRAAQSRRRTCQPGAWDGRGKDSLQVCCMPVQEVPAGRKEQQTLPGSRDEPLPAPSSFLTGSTVPPCSSAGHSLQLWRQNWWGARAPVLQADIVRWC